MVSFQCDACVDVVKKPKLDSHYSRCKSSFTCVDCSTTFAGPTQWKSHTSCMSEAEKYQKGLYKGKKAVNVTNGMKSGSAAKDSKDPGAENAALADTAVASQGEFTDPSSLFPRPHLGRLGDRSASGSYQHDGGANGPRQDWAANAWRNGGSARPGRPRGSNFGYQRNMGTGANDIPLGSPLRMTMSPSNSETNTHTPLLTLAVNTNGSSVNSENIALDGKTPSKSKDKSDKKQKNRKSDAEADVVKDADKDIKKATSIIQESPESEALAKESKPKKRKSEAGKGSPTKDEQTVTTNAGGVERKEKKRKIDKALAENAEGDGNERKEKKQKKDKSKDTAESIATYAADQVNEASNDTNAREKGTKNKREKKDKLTVEPDHSIISDDKESGDSSEAKKRKGHSGEDGSGPAEKEGKRKEKKDKSKMKHKISAADES